MADFVVTVSPRDCQQLQRQYRKHKNKMCVIYNGYDENRINKELSDEEKIKVDKVFKQIDGFYSIGVFGKFGYYDYEYVRQMLSAVKVLSVSAALRSWEKRGTVIQKRMWKPHL